jgi:ribosomal protein S10
VFKAPPFFSCCRVALPTQIQKYTVLKSIHIFKKHRVQYEVRTHMRLMEVKEITGTTADVFLEYIQRNLPEGVSMSVNQVREREWEVGGDFERGRDCEWS